jgi:hypothetical protein
VPLPRDIWSIQEIRAIARSGGKCLGLGRPAAA